MYKYVFVLDDDLNIDGDRINEIFELADKLDLWVCQPSFNIKGKISHKITVQRLFSYLRFTNFVEVTCPLFKTAKLIDFLDVYDDKLIGYGIDWWMMDTLLPPKDKVAIIDYFSCINPLDSDKANTREIDLLQTHDERKRIWAEIKVEKNLTIDEKDYKTYSSIYSLGSLLGGLLKLDQVVYKYIKKWHRHAAKKKHLRDSV